MEGRTGGWRDKQADGGMGGWMGEQMGRRQGDRRMYGPTNGCADEQRGKETCGRKDRRADGQMDGLGAEGEAEGWRG